MTSRPSDDLPDMITQNQFSTDEYLTNLFGQVTGIHSGDVVNIIDDSTMRHAVVNIFLSVSNPIILKSLTYLLLKATKDNSDVQSGVQRVKVQLNSCRDNSRRNIFK